MGKLYLIPTPLGEMEQQSTLPPSTLEALRNLDTFVVEELKTARHFLSAAGFRGRIDSLHLYTLNEHTSQSEVEAYLPLFDAGDVGLLSEAGLPAVADPGSALVALAHSHGIEVVPLVGPSSLMLALMASGLNGQSFAFRGYLPVKPAQRLAALKSFEKKSAVEKQSEIFIETPYRNDSLFADMLSCLSPSTMLTVAADLTLESQFCRTMNVGAWRGLKDFAIGKRPCVFIMLAS